MRRPHAREAHSHGRAAVRGLYESLQAQIPGEVKVGAGLCQGLR